MEARSHSARAPLPCSTCERKSFNRFLRCKYFDRGRARWSPFFCFVVNAILIFSVPASTSPAKIHKSKKKIDISTLENGISRPGLTTAMASSSGETTADLLPPRLSANDLKGPSAKGNLLLSDILGLSPCPTPPTLPDLSTVKTYQVRRLLGLFIHYFLKLYKHDSNS